MRNWTLRELPLLVTVLGFVLFHVTDAIRLRIVPFEDFVVSRSELESWAKEIDPDSRYWSGGHSSGKSSSLRGTLSDGSYSLEFEVGAAKSEQIVRHWQKRLEEKIAREGWTIRGHGSGPTAFSYSLRKSDSMHKLNLHATTEPIPDDPSTGKKDRAWLTLHWVAVSFTRLYDGMREAEPAPAPQ